MLPLPASQVPFLPEVGGAGGAELLLLFVGGRRVPSNQLGRREPQTKPAVLPKEESKSASMLGEESENTGTMKACKAGGGVCGVCVCVWEKVRYGGMVGKEERGGRYVAKN